MQKTAFYECHLSSGGKVVDFGGFALPVNYGSQIKEHEIVRSDAGMFDVSHMVVRDLTGPDARKYLRYLLSNDVNKLDKHGLGKALYSGMLNSEAGVIDDLIVYLTDFGYRIVTNAGTNDKDTKHMLAVASNFDVKLVTRDDLAMLAVQGPKAIDKVAKLKPMLADKLSSLKLFSSFEDAGYFYARTGYTGENGLEIMLPISDVEKFWNELISVEISPCGLGARDTLRLEAGMNLYGHEMDESITPLECGMDWVVDLSDNDRDFLGKKRYVALKSQGSSLSQVGLILLGKGVLRDGQEVVINGKKLGVVTSGTFSPTMKQSIAIARVDMSIAGDVCVDIRGNLVPVKVVKLPFVRNGAILV